MLGKPGGLQYLVVIQCIVAEAQAQAFFVDGSSMSGNQVTNPTLHVTFDWHLSDVGRLCFLYGAAVEWPAALSFLPADSRRHLSADAIA